MCDYNSNKNDEKSNNTEKFNDYPSYETYLNELINSDIKYRTKQNETINETNERIRNSIRVNFNKIFLNEENIKLFREWEEVVKSLPMTATRKELYGSAPEQCLYIIGI
jgi:hypothetical protein